MRKGRYVSTPPFLLKWKKNTLGRARIAIVVSTKVSKKATDRNRIKRRAREIMKAHPTLLHLSLDIVFIARMPAATLSFEELKKTVHAAISKISV